MRKQALETSQQLTSLPKLLGQVPEALVWVGGAVIFLSTVYLAYRETVVSRRARRTVDPPLPPG